MNDIAVGAPDRPVIRKFNPGTLQSDEEVIRQFAVRGRELDTVLEILRGNVDSPSCEHVLLVAPRGRGKTMLLARVAAALRTDETLSRDLLPVRFMEESHEIFDLADFWLEALFYLAIESARSEPALVRELREALDDLGAAPRGDALAQRARAAVLETAGRLGKKLVLMVENLQSLCGDVDAGFGWQLRETLQSEPQIVLVGTATVRFKGLDDATQPFFEMFRIVDLTPLTTGECVRLWRAVSGETVSERPIRPLEILTGGSPRLLVILAGFARHWSMLRLMEELVRLIDDHTEYFRSNLEAIPKTERRVYLAVIDLWQPSTAGEIAARSRLDVRTVSTMLGRLVNRGAAIIQGNGGKRRYATAERLYTIYYKLRRERDEAGVVHNLIRFMTAFYSESELKTLSRSLLIDSAKRPAIQEGLTRAIGDSPQLGSIFSSKTWRENRQFPRADLAADDQQFPNALDELDDAMNKNEFAKVIEIASQILASEDTGSLNTSAWATAFALLAKAYAYEGLGDDEAELAIYDEVVHRFGESDSPELQLLIATALLRKGITQREREEEREASSTFDEMVHRFGNSDIPEINVHVARALINRGIGQEQLNNAPAAISAFDEVVERFGTSQIPELRLQAIIALRHKGIRLEKQGQFWEAITAFDDAIGRVYKSELEGALAVLAETLHHKGFVLHQLGESAAASEIDEEILERFGDSDAPEMQALVSSTLVRVGLRQGHQGEIREAIDTFKTMVERFGDADTLETQVLVAIALVNKGVRLGQLGNAEAAMRSFDELIERFGSSDAPQIHEGVARALNAKAFALEQDGAFAAAITIYESVLNRFRGSEMPVIQNEVIRALVNRTELQIGLGHTEGVVRVCDELDGRLNIIPKEERPDLAWRISWLRTRALLVQQKYAAAMAMFEQVYAAFDPNSRTMMLEMLERVPNFIADGASENDLLEIFFRDKEKADALLPLVVALRQREGEAVRAPSVVLEVADDIRKRIETKVNAANVAPNGPQSD